MPYCVCGTSTEFTQRVSLQQKQQENFVIQTTYGKLPRNVPNISKPSSEKCTLTEKK